MVLVDDLETIKLHLRVSQLEQSSLHPDEKIQVTALSKLALRLFADDELCLRFTEDNPTYFQNYIKSLEVPI